jgi:hypothetical protein
LSGSGSMTGPVTVGGKFNPGPINATGGLSANGGLTFASGSALTFDLSVRIRRQATQWR